MSCLIGMTGEDDVVTDIVLGLFAHNYSGAVCGLAIKDKEIATKNIPNNVYHELSHLDRSQLLGKIGIGYMADKRGQTRQPIHIKSNNTFIATDCAKPTTKKIIDIAKECASLEDIAKAILTEVPEPFAFIGLDISGKIIATKNNGRISLYFGEPMHDHLNTNRGFCITSQSGIISFDKELAPGRIVILKDHSCLEQIYRRSLDPTLCLQYVTFYAKPGGRCGGKYVTISRQNMGRELGRKFANSIKVDNPKECMALPILFGGTDVLKGFSETSGIPSNPAGSLRSTYPRDPNIPIPNDGYALIETQVRKNVVIVDDTIKSGRRIKRFARLARENSAEKVFGVVIAIVLKGCPYGKPLITIPAYKREDYIDNLAKRLALDGLIFLTVQEQLEAINDPHHNYCDECLTSSSV